ncbi:tetratricopeptide repeat protein [Paraburkholderia xenovorans]|uniref:tetratricopeptide repeat protein n=1 Tax=Paraburkholderia xenovorans TaxID=36873 RepID=UPI0015595C19|nr:tetratricopeptide repeat protein [Paraburkholderia xenovorans]NPT33736.1 tetratricopeptide repeat protein [Paraburkholderia xenovorans]
MPTYKCPTVGDCERANAGEIFVRSPGEDLHCPDCSTLLELQTTAVAKGRNKKVIAAGIAVAVVAVVGAGGGFLYKHSHPAPEASAQVVAAPLDGAASASPAAVAIAPVSSPVAATSVGISPSEAEISAQRKDSDTKLSQGDASGAESASNQVAAKEMVKVAIAQMSQGKLDEAEKELNDAAIRDPKQSLVYYNMAVLRLKQGRTDDALKEFEASFLNGFAYFDEMQKDPDLDGIRNDPRFTALVKKYRTTT